MGKILGKATGVGQAKTTQAENPVTKEQLNRSFQLTDSALAGQQNVANQLVNPLTGVLEAQSSVFNQQQDLANALQAQALGQGPNPAQEQFKQNLNDATSAAAGTIASQKGISPALAAELIARQQGAVNQNAAGTAATMQAQQQLNAQNQLAQQQQAIQGAAQQQIGNTLSATGALTEAAQGNQNQLLGTTSSMNQFNAGAQNATNLANSAQQGGLIGGILSGAGTAIAGRATSDIRAKENIKPLDSKSFLDHLKGYEYDYKDPSKHGEGPQVGVMAQDLEKELPGAVIDSPDGTKVIDYNKMGGPMLAALTEMNQRLKNVEGNKMAEGGEILKEFYTEPDKSKPIPGKPKVDHNSYENDNVKALLSPGEVVLPLDVMNSKDPVKSAAKFVEALLKKNKTNDSAKSEFHEALKTAMTKRKK